MAVSATLRLEPAERARLRQVLNCGDAELETRLEPFATAALEEYVRMFIGSRVFTRGSDIREYRLLLLMENVWKRVPADNEVSGLFQTTASQSRALTRAVLSKFRYDLAGPLEASVRAVVQDAKRLSDSDLQLVIGSANLVDAINDRIQELDATLPRLIAGEGVATYRLKQSAYEKLSEALDLKPKR